MSCFISSVFIFSPIYDVNVHLTAPYYDSTSSGYLLSDVEMDLV